MIPAAERHEPGSLPHQHIGGFYRARFTGGSLRPEPDGATTLPPFTSRGQVTGA